MKNILFLLLLMIGVLFYSCSSHEEGDFIASPEEVDQYLQVPSPDWEDQIIYFIVTDRFMDGDTSNNDQGAGEYKKGHGGYWNGGDLRGITQKIDYIKELGPTGIWITPPVANQWVNPQQSGTGNHGYWASSFVEVDKHLGTLEDYRQLSASLHKNGMYLIQDVVVNHLGDFYTYTGPYNPDDVTENFKVHDVPQPTQYPFHHNNANDPKGREMAIFHFTPNFQDHSDSIKKRLYQFADLDDLNTSNPVVRKVLRESYNFWIKEAGVDGFRFDTPMMVEHEFWHDFLHSSDAEAPGIVPYARSQGKADFLNFGETLIPTHPYEDSKVREAARYLGTASKPEMQSILNFPLFFAIHRVFQELKPTDIMTHRLKSIENIFPRPELLLNFIDNHDGARFLTRADHSSFRQALLFTMTIPGIPVIYYGTEQVFRGTRQAMFRGGVGSPDQDHFNTGNEAFQFVQNLTSLRKEHAVFRRGELEVLQDTPGGPGVFAYRLQHEGENTFVLFNTAETEKIADNIQTGLKPGTSLESLFSLSEETDQAIIDQNGNLSMLLPAKAGLVLVTGKVADSTPMKEKKITIHALKDQTISTDFLTVSGTAAMQPVYATVDGDYRNAVQATTATDGGWTAKLPLYYLANGNHRLTAFSMNEQQQDLVVSDDIGFKLKLPAVLIAEYKDKTGDDHGPAGKYQYPPHPGYTRQMDIASVKVYRLGTNLEIDIGMGAITQTWIPPNEFDHALINIYIDLPGKAGASSLPFQNAVFPAKGNWDYLVSTAGFGNAVFSSEGASATHPGQATGPTPSVAANIQTNTITFTIAAEAIGYPSSLRGTKIYITTWDGGPAELRELKPEPEPWVLSGGSESDPKIMDDTEVILLK